MPHPLRAFVTLTAAVSMVAAPAAAQGPPTNGVGASAVVVAASHPLFSAPLVGGALTFSAPLGQRFTARYGVERVSAASHRIGVACEGFVPVEANCVAEPLRDDGWLGTISAGLAMRVLEARRTVVDVALDARAGGVAVDTRGLRSGRTLHDGTLMIGGEVEVAGAWWPSPRVPLAIEAGVGAGGLGPMSPNHVQDGYEPFRSGFGLTRFRIGLALRGLGR